MKCSRMLTVLAVLAFWVNSAHGDVIYLKDGTQKEGEIVEETDTVVKIKVYSASGGSVVWPIPRDKIEKIERKEFVKPEPPKEEEPEPEPVKKEKKKDEIPPAPPSKRIEGYRAATWGASLSNVHQSGMRETMRVPAYIRRLNPPEDIAKRLPEDYIPPRDAGFSNVKFTRHGDYPEYKTVYLAFHDGVYLIWGKEPLEIIGYVKRLSDWVQDRRKELGGETELKEDGTMIWDQESAYACFTPAFKSEEKPSPSTYVDHYTFVLYCKNRAEKVLEWAKQNLPAAE